MEIIKKLQSSLDNTIKYRFITDDNMVFEACVIFFDESSEPINICISSQLGCECSCSFCATGKKKFKRNLSDKELIQQVDMVLEQIENRNGQKFEITFMGTGEPLQNISSVFSAINIMNERYKNLARINLSSIFTKLDFSLDNLLELKRPIHFQYSLHFLTDEGRAKYFCRKLAPINDVLSLLDKVTNIYDDPYCINYILFDGINDSKEDARCLAQLVKSHNAYAKISEYCPIHNSFLKPSNNKDEFIEELMNLNIKWKTFTSKGTDIHAACGHLLADVDF